jgi:hypothetical protein
MCTTNIHGSYQKRSLKIKKPSYQISETKGSSLCSERCCLESLVLPNQLHNIGKLNNWAAIYSTMPNGLRETVENQRVRKKQGTRTYRAIKYIHFSGAKQICSAIQTLRKVEANARKFSDCSCDKVPDDCTSLQ